VLVAKTDVVVVVDTFEDAFVVVAVLLFVVELVTFGAIIAADANVVKVGAIVVVDEIEIVAMVVNAELNVAVDLVDVSVADTEKPDEVTVSSNTVLIEVVHVPEEAAVMLE
jgi:hypothetical protein